MKDYKDLKVQEPSSVKEAVWNLIGAVGFCLFIGSLPFLRGCML